MTGLPGGASRRGGGGRDGPAGGARRDLVPRVAGAPPRHGAKPDAPGAAAAGARPAGPSPSSCRTRAGRYSGVAAATAFRLLAAGGVRARRRRRSLAPGLFRRYALDDATAYRTPIGDVPLSRGRPRRAARRGRARRAGRHRAGARGRDRAAVPAGDPRPLLPGAGPRRRHGRAPSERAFAERLATLDDGRDPLRLLLRLLALRPALRLPPFGPLSPAAGRRCARWTTGAPGSSPASTRRASATSCARRGTRSAAATASPRCWSCCRGSRPRPGASLLAHYASGDMPGDAGRQLRRVRRPGLPTRGGERTRPCADAAAHRGAAPAPTPRRLRLSLGEAHGSCASPAARSTAHFLERDDLERGARGVARRAPAGAPAGRLRDAQPEGPGGGRAPGRAARLHRAGRADLPARLWRSCRSALDAALARPALPEVEAAELPELSIEVTVLSPRSSRRLVAGDPARDARDRPREGRARRRSSCRRSPPEQGWTLEETLDAPRRRRPGSPAGMAERGELLRLHGAGLPRGAAALT